jgi:F-type H+-transporting ATPase subunit epsilon
MTPFSLTIVTPDGLAFEGQVEELVVRTTGGDIGICAKHADLVAALGMGRATVVQDGKKRYAACIGGMVSVLNGQVKLVPTTFEWAEEIDADRAEAALQRAKKAISSKESTDTDIRLAEAKIRRALVRKGVASMK